MLEEAAAASSGSQELGQRRGGRGARVALRSAPLSDDLQPIRPGMKGGTYRPLDDAGVLRIHEAALDALEQIGLSQAPDTGVAYMVKAGAILGEDNRLRFPRGLVKEMLAKTKRGMTLYGRNTKYDLLIEDKRVYFGTAGAAVYYYDVVNDKYRETTAKDLYQAAQLAEQLDNIHFFQRSMVCRDVSNNLDMDLNTLYACLAGTAKHVGTSISDPSHVEAIFDVLHMVAGGEAAWRERPFVSCSNCFVVPPMRFATESCQTMEDCIERGMPILLLSAGQAGATAPANLALAVVQAVAECLAGVVYVNSIKPGHPVIFGTWPFVSDLRTGAMSGGSGEQALLTAACAQMHQHYDLPGGAAAGIADSKRPDMQAGWEQAISNVMAGLSGLNMVYESVGMHASLLGFSHESMVLGDDLLGQVQRCVRGMEVTAESVSLDAMKDVCLGGPGHYLGHDQTLNLMQRDYVYPKVADRYSPKEWEEYGRPILVESATKRKDKILSNPTKIVSDSIDAAVRAKYKIYF